MHVIVGIFIWLLYIIFVADINLVLTCILIGMHNKIYIGSEQFIIYIYMIYIEKEKT